MSAGSTPANSAVLPPLPADAHAVMRLAAPDAAVEAAYSHSYAEARQKFWLPRATPGWRCSRTGIR